MKRGDIYWANLNPRSGSEQKGMRPVIIISHDGFNMTTGWRSIIIIPITTSKKQASRGPTVVHLPKETCGLSDDSIALCHQVTTLDKEKLTQFVGSLSIDLLKQVETALKAAVDLNE